MGVNHLYGGGSGGGGGVGGSGLLALRRRSGGQYDLGPDASAEDVKRALAAMRTEEYIRNFTSGTGAQTVEQRTAQALSRLLAPNPAADPRVTAAGADALASGVDYDEQTLADLGVTDISRVATLAGRKEMSGWAERNLGPPVAKVLDYINRPQQAMMEVIQAASYDTGLNKVLENGLGNDSGDALTPTAKGSLGSGGYRDAIRAFQGKPRWNPSSGEWTHNLDYSEALGMDRRGRKDNALGKLEGGADFIGGAALDPLNFLGGGTKAAATAVQKTAAREVLADVAEEGMSDALRATLRSTASEVTPEAIEGALRRTGLRKGLTKEQQATLRDVLVAERAAGEQTTGRLSGKIRTLAPKDPERAALRQLDSAMRYDRGGLRPFGRSLTPEALREPVRNALRGRTLEYGDTAVASRVMDRVPELRERLVAVMDRKGELADKAAARHEALLARKITKPDDALETAAERAYSNLIDAKAAVPDGNIQVTDELRSAMTELSYRLDEAVSRAATGRVADNDWLPFASSMLGEFADTARTLVADERFDDLLKHFETFALPKANMLPTWAIIGDAAARGLKSEALGALRPARKAGWDARKEALSAVKRAEKELTKATQAAANGTKVDRKVLKRLEADYQRALRYQEAANEAMARIDALDAARTAEEAVAAEPALVNVADPVRAITPGLASPTGTKVTNRAVKKIKEGLVPRASLGWSERLPSEVADSVYDASSGSLATANAYKSQVVGQIRAAGTKAAGQIDDGLRRAALEALETGPQAVADLRATLTDEQAHWLDTLAKIRDADSAVNRAKGLMNPAKMRGDDYMLHEMTPEGRKALETALNATRYEIKFSKYRGMASGARTAAAQRGSLLPRVFKDKKVWEIEEELGDLLRQEGLLKPDQKLMITDPEELVVRRADRTAKALQQAEYLDELSKQKGALGEDLVIRVRPGAKAPKHASGMIRHPLGEGGEILVHPDLAEHVIPYFDMLQTDDLAKGFGRKLDQWQRLWKTYATIPVGIGTGFTAKNATGNIVANYVRGLTNPAWYFRSARLQNAIRKASKEFPELPLAEALERSGMAAGDVAKIDKMLEDAVLDEKFISIDLDEGITTDALSRTRPLSEKVRNKIDPRRVWKNPAEGLGAQSGRAINAAVEDNARMALWLWEFERSGSAKMATQTVKEVLFDYGDLTPFERKVMRRINAFYTFTRKNIPLQFQELGRNPAGLNRVSQAEQFLLGGDELSDPNTPEYLLSSGGFAGRKGLAGLLTGNDKSGVVLNAETPFEAAIDQVDPLVRIASGDFDAQKIASSLGSNISGGPAEAVKQLFETASGGSTFTGASLKDQSGDYKMNPLWRGTQAFIPATGKFANLTGLGKRQTNPLQIRAFRLLTGLQANEVTDEMTEGEKERKLQELYDIIDALKADNVDVPTVEELRALGILKDKAG